MVEVSIVVPLYNEEAVVQELYERLVKSLEPLHRAFEIVFVDDGSVDKTYRLAEEIAKKDERVKLVKLRANFGQTGGIAAGIDHASGDIKKRVDGLFLRRIPSKMANLLMKWLSGIDLHDFGTTFKAYRRDAISQVRLYGQFHRFIPVLCRSVMKLKITEIPIQNIVRPAGKSNYGIWRTFTVFFDLIRLKFLMSFFHRPLMLFGSIFAGVTLGTLGPSIFLLATTLGVTGLLLFCVGLLAELMVKLYIDGNRVRPYVVERITNECPRAIHPWPVEPRRDQPQLPERKPEKVS